ncbi:MAG: type II toxin-antitoxin system prevent-host-death family antitoxin [Clostridia bacterium]|nr:type II toxin-antitoxin system prevent-host-death family antitoxin [Clostridia bacterium]
MTIATATQVQNSFGRYLSAVMNGDEVVVMKNGKEVARLISKKASAGFLTDALTGVIGSDFDEDKLKAERYERQ